MGTKRSFKNYMDMVGLNTETKVATTNLWCHKGEWPEQVIISSFLGVVLLCLGFYLSSLTHLNKMELDESNHIYFS